MMPIEHWKFLHRKYILRKKKLKYIEKDVITLYSCFLTYCWQTSYIFRHSVYPPISARKLTQTGTSSSFPKLWWKCESLLREGILRKNCCSFGFCPNFPPPPHFGQLVQLFSDVEIQDLKDSLGLKMLHVYYRLFIDNLKNSLKFKLLVFWKK